MAQAAPASKTAARSAAKPSSSTSPLQRAAKPALARKESVKPPAYLQAKLAVSHPQDGAEREADHVARQIMRAAKAAPAVSPSAGAQVQRASLEPAITPEKNETLALKPVPAARAIQRRPQSSEQKAQRESADAQGADAMAGATVDSGLEARIEARRGAGSPLPADLMQEMSARFGHDFSAVHVHTDAEAAELCAQTHARAFTVGCDIFFAPGEFAPETDEGKELLAHELTHVVQQAGGAQALHRQVEPGLPARFRAGSDTPAALTDLEALEIPAIKARHLPLYSSLAEAGNLKRIKSYHRDGADQRQVWLDTVEVQESEIRARLGERNIPVPATTTQRIPLRLRNRPTKKNITELQSLLRIPDWNRQGRNCEFQVDHIVELQVSGEIGSGIGNSIENMELLDQPSNSSSGGTIRGGIYTKAATYLESFTPVMDRGRFFANHDVVFTSVHVGSGGSPADNSRWWTKTDIEHAEPLREAETAPPTAEGAADMFVLSSGPGGIEVGRFPHDATQTTIHPEGPAARRLAGMVINTITLNDHAGTGEENVSIGSIDASWDLPVDWMPTPASVTLDLQADGDYRGFPSGIPALGLEFAHLSPVSLGDVSVEDGELQASGPLTPSLSLLNAPLMVTVRGQDVTFSLNYSPEQISLPIPGVTIDDATLSVFYSTQRGLGVGGQIFYSVNNIGSGDLSASFSTSGGVVFEGGFSFDHELFDRARVRAWWRNGEVGAEGEIGIDTPNKIRGVRSASLTVGVNDGNWYFRGGAELSIPGIDQATISVRQTETGLIIEGDVNLTANAAIRSGQIHVTCTKESGEWKVAATGTAQPAIPGINSELTVGYDDGAFTAEFSGAYARGMLSGNATVGVTNRTVGEDGQPTGPAAEPDAPLIVYGDGSATIQIAPWLQGTAGLRLAPNGEVTISGEIGLPNSLEIFSRRELNRQLFNMSTQIPIVPGIVAEVGGSLNANASIGPGVLDQARIGIEYNPSHEENTHVTGDAHLNIPAEAGVRLAARAGVGLGITGASATGGLELGGTLGIDGAAEASVHVDWMPNRGLQIDAEGYLHAEPKFKFDVSGYVAVTALGFSVYDQRWELAAYELGSNLRLGVRFPIHYREGEPFDVSLDDVVFEVPDIDPAALVNDLGSQIF